MLYLYVKTKQQNKTKTWLIGIFFINMSLILLVLSGCSPDPVEKKQTNPITMYFNSLKLLFNHKHINCKPKIFFIVDFTPHLCLIINACFWHSRVSIHQVPQPLPPKVSFFLQETKSTYFLSKRYTSKSINLLKHFVIFKLLFNWQKNKKLTS